MVEAMVAPDVEKEAQEFKAGKTGDEAWAEKMIARGAEERAGEKVEDLEPKETEPAQKWGVRLEDGGVAQIDKYIAETEVDVKLEFSKEPDQGKILRLEKPGVLTRFYAVEEPLRGVKKQENTVYLRTMLKDEVEERQNETAEDIRGYLTSETIEKLALPAPETVSPAA